MGVLDFLFKGMGFEGEEKPTKKPKKKTSVIPVEENVVKKDMKRSENFDLFTAASFPTSSTNNYTEAAKSMLVHEPKSNKDIQIIVDTLRRHESAIVNLGALTPADAEKILDFLSGAVYALKGNLRRLEGDLFLLTPEGINIVSPTDNK